MDIFPAFCPYCGEPVELVLDEAGGTRQRYVEDCPVCCGPWEVEATRHGEEDWDVVLRTADE